MNPCAICELAKPQIEDFLCKECRELYNKHWEATHKEFNYDSCKPQFTNENQPEW